MALDKTDTVDAIEVDNNTDVVRRIHRMLINKETGTLSLGERSYAPNMPVGEFEISPAGSFAQLSVDNPPWKSYRHQFYENTSALWLFKSGALKEIHLVLLQGRNADSAFLTDEKMRKQIHDEALYDCLGLPPYSYKWGQVMSITDQRSGGAMIIIRYGE